MGQKTNSNIFRLGIKKNEWKSKYIEKNSEESSLYTHNDLEIQKYLARFLSLNGLIFHDYKLHYSKATIQIFISYYTTLKAIFLINKLNIKQKIKLNKKNIKKRKKTFVLIKTRPKNRLKLIKKYKKFLLVNKLKNTNTFKTNNFIEQLFESLNIFTKNKYNIVITFQNLNKSLSLRLKNFQTESFIKILLHLRQYSKNHFFKETINILLISINKKKSARLLSEFIAFQLQNLKRHRFFLIFLKRALKLCFTIKSIYINGIKISVKGRLNGVPRTKSQNILIGNVPLQKFDANINHFQTISYTPNGTFGIKVWIFEK